MKFFSAALIATTAAMAMAMAVPFTQKRCEGVSCPTDLVSLGETTDAQAAGAPASGVTVIVDVIVSATAIVADVKADVQADLDLIGTRY